MIATALLLAAMPAAPTVTVPAAPPPLIRMPVPAPPSAERGAKGAKAQANLASYVTSDDYPAEAMRAREQGTTGFRLTVGPDGRVMDCAIVASSGSALLDSTTCRIMRSRPRFTPAQDAAGKPIADSVTGRIAWRLPTARPVPDMTDLRFAIGADGRAHSCRLEARIGIATQSQAAPDCSTTPPPTALIAALRGQSSASTVRARVATRLLRDPALPWPALERGAKLVSRQTSRVQVAADGRVVSCTLLETSGPVTPAGQLCRAGSMIVGHAGGATEMRMIGVIMLEGEPAQR